MFVAVTKLEGLSHPLVESIYLKRESHGNTLIIETGFIPRDGHRADPLFEKLLLGLGNLVARAENSRLHVDFIEIRIGGATERAAA